MEDYALHQKVVAEILRNVNNENLIRHTLYLERLKKARARIARLIEGARAGLTPNQLLGMGLKVEESINDLNNYIEESSYVLAKKLNQ